MTEINRRRMLHVLGAAPVAAVALTWSPAEATAAARQGAASPQPYQPRFFTPSEYATVGALADMVIPRDDRSGSATDAGTHAFIDYIVAEQPDRQTGIRGGLVWLDSESRRRFDKPFLQCSIGERSQVLDDIAFPARARPEMSHGVRFFTSFRDLVATGFWTSRMGVDDLGYTGNRPDVWSGPPREVMVKLGV